MKRLLGLAVVLLVISCNNPSGDDEETYTVSGYVRTIDQQGIQNVFITVGGKTAISNENGFYTVSGFEDGTYTATPNKSGFTFTPASRPVVVDGENVTAIDFTGAETTTASITITSPQPGATLTIGEETVISWTASTAAVDTVDILLYKGDALHLTIAAHYYSSSKTCAWTPGESLSEGNDYSIMVRDSQHPTVNSEVILNRIRKLVPISFVSIPGGTFMMGDNDHDGDSSELPVHEVTISGFEMSITEVTQAQYVSVMGTNPSQWRGDTLPVESMNWQTAARFCNKLSEQDSLEKCYDESTWLCDYSRNGYRMPTEAEWEYACRAGTSGKFYTGVSISQDGNTSSDLDRAGWYKGNSGETTHPVGQKEPNAWGLYDMLGNVWERCNDWFALYPVTGAATNPVGPASGSLRVNRGGGYQDGAWHSRVSARGYSPMLSEDLGIRLVRHMPHD
jgi:formylglycine-generating enzyme